MDIQLHSPPFISPKSHTTNEGASLTDNLKHFSKHALFHRSYTTVSKHCHRVLRNFSPFNSVSRISI